ncbi:MAG: hypothetical protein L0Y36_05325 [Planctomycetales bacterium]|nr:hypothetical protein [Planctomycetales bacterium]
MLRLAQIIRFLLFAVFFLAGTGAMVLSILADPELVNYYHSRSLLLDIQRQNDKIQSLSDQYDAQIDLIEDEPNILERLTPMTFGRKPSAPDTAFPQARNSTLLEETQNLMAQLENKTAQDPIPGWLKRIRNPKLRRALFAAGAGLLLVTFIFFGSSRGNLIEEG